MNKKIVSFVLLSTLLLSACSSLKKSKKNSNAPTYEGMTIAETNNYQLNALRGDNNNDNSHAGQHDNGNHYGHNNDTDEEIETEINNLIDIDVETDDEVKNFVSPGRDFIIEVHLSNPKNYEIQSFTLNGVKYANYMFEKGSSLELLLLKTQAPSESGYHPYTIDAIKYIDGTEIKDVDMSHAEKTIKVGVKHLHEPNANIQSYVIGTNYLDFTVLVNDQDSLIQAGTLFAYLSDGEQQIESKPLQIGSNDIRFDNLLMVNTYQLGIVGVYDLVDGRYLHEEWFVKESFRTDSAFKFVSVDSDTESISYDIEKTGEVGEIKSISYVDLVTNASVDITDNELHVIDGLLSNHSYQLSLTYQYPCNNETVDQVVYYDIQTNTKDAPEIIFDKIILDIDSIEYSVQVKDSFDICQIDSVDLYLEDETFVKSNETLLEGKFTDLLSDTTYEIVVSYHFDRNDGNGQQEEKANVIVSTKAREIPAFVPNQIELDNSELCFDEHGAIIGIADTHDDIIYVNAPITDHAFEGVEEFSTLVIGEGCTLIGEEAFNSAFSITTVIVLGDQLPGLVFNTFGGVWDSNFTVYCLDSHYDEFVNFETDDYWWNVCRNRILAPFSQMDENLENNLFKFIETTKNSLSYTFTVRDVDNTITGVKVELFDGSQVVETKQDSLSGNFENLLSDHSYNIKATITYDLKDGKTVDVVCFEKHAKTNFKYKPVILLGNFQPDDSELSFDSDGYIIGLSSSHDDIIYLNAPVKEEAFESCQSFKTLVIGDGCTYIGKQAFNHAISITTVVIVAKQLPELVYNTFGQVWDSNFAVYCPDNQYENFVNYATNDTLWNSIRSRIFARFSTMPASLEKQIFQYAVTTTTSLGFRFTLNDVDNTVLSKKVELFDGSDLVAIVNDSFTGEFTNLISNHSYKLKATISYDLNDGNGVVLTSVERAVETNAKQKPTLMLSGVIADDEELTLDENGYVTGINVLHDDTIYIDHPIKANAFENANNIETVILGAGCTYIGESAFADAYSVKNIILLSRNLPTLVYNTFSSIWDYDTFKFYVFDEDYERIKNTSTDDELWNARKDQCLARYSSMPAELESDIFHYIISTNDSIEYSFSFVDSDDTLVSKVVELYDGENKIAENTTSLSGTFDGLLSNHQYSIRVHYEYDLNDGLGNQQEIVSENVTTVSCSEAQILFNRSGEALNGTSTLSYEPYGSGYNVNGFGTFMGNIVVLGGIYNGLPVTDVGQHALINCNWINSAIVLDTVTHLHAEVFYGVPLKQIIFQSTVPPTLDYNVLGYNQAEVYVPDEAYDAYASIPNDSLWLTSIVNAGHLHRFSELGVNFDEFFYGTYDAKITSNSYELGFSLNDPDSTIVSVTGYLYCNDALIQTVENLVGTIPLSELTPDTSYKLVIEYVYNLHDGGENITKTIPILFETLES